MSQAPVYERVRDAGEGGPEVKQNESTVRILNADLHRLLVNVNDICEHRPSWQKPSLHP